MYSCVFWCEFIDLDVFWHLLCDPCHSLHRKKNRHRLSCEKEVYFGNTCVTRAWDACGLTGGK